MELRDEATAGRARANKAPAARLKQQLQQLMSERPIVVPKVRFFWGAGAKTI